MRGEELLAKRGGRTVLPGAGERFDAEHRHFLPELTAWKVALMEREQRQRLPPVAAAHRGPSLIEQRNFFPQIAAGRRGRQNVRRLDRVRNGRDRRRALDGWR